MRLSDLHHSLAAQLRLKIVAGLEGAMSTKSLDANGVHSRRKLRWRRAKKKSARSSFTDEKVKDTALFEPPDLTLVSGTKGRPGRSDMLT